MLDESLPIVNKNAISIWDTNYLELQKNDAPDLIEIDPDVYTNESINFEDEPIYQEEKKHPLYFKNKTFSVHEAACLMTGYNPRETHGRRNRVVWLEANPEYEEAVNFIYSFLRSDAIQDLSDGEFFIDSDRLKNLLTESDILIFGFNDIPVIDSDISEQYQQENKELLEKVKQLEKELYQEKSQSFLLASDYQFSQSEITTTKEKISEKDAAISKLKKSIKLESDVSDGLYTDLTAAKDENAKLRAQINLIESQNVVLENEKLQTNAANNAINDTKINLINSDLLLIGALLKMLQSEIKAKGNKSQAKILQRIEDEHRDIKGLSKSRTDKLMGSAKNLYKPLINKRMK